MVLPKVPLAVKRKWGQMIENYLLNRNDLKVGGNSRGRSTLDSRDGYSDG